jgi:hypothetical protein
MAKQNLWQALAKVTSMTQGSLKTAGLVCHGSEDKYALMINSMSSGE